MITWNKDWIQAHESLWGIFEKFKFANQINGKEFFYYFTENKKATYTSKSVHNKSIAYLNSIAKDKLSKIFNVDIEIFNDKLVKLSKSPFSNLSIFNDNLCFCKTCISEGYHSMLHQYLFIAFCPFHPEEQLTDKCPKCNNYFRNYNLGYNEQGFCCSNCEFNILKSKDFYFIKKEWVNLKKIKDKYLLSLKNNIFASNFSAQYVFSTDLTTAAINNPVYTIINKRILEVLANKKSLPVVIENRYSFSLAYKKSNDENYKVGYVHRELLRIHQKNWMIEPDSILQISKFKSSNDIDYLNKILDFELFIKSKAILKSVDRYIQRKSNRKINLKKEIKKKSIKNPYIKAYRNWKIYCYGLYQAPHKIFSTLGIYTPTFEFRYPFEFNQTETYPTLANSRIFNQIISKYKNENYSFILIANVFSKVLFNFLYMIFQQYLSKSLKSAEDFFPTYNMPPFIQLTKIDNSGVLEVSFINSFELFNGNFSMVDNPSIKWLFIE